MGCGASAAQAPQARCDSNAKLGGKSLEFVKFVPGDAAIIQNCLNARLNGERVICESYNNSLGEWLVKGNKFPLSVGMSLGVLYLQKVDDNDIEVQEVDEEYQETRSRERTGAETLGQSRFNAAYSCNVLRIEAMQQGVIELDFDVYGDGSLGPLQDPSDSILGGKRVQSHSYDICNRSRRIKGTLVFPADLNCPDNVCFTFGSAGYSSIELQVKKHSRTGSTEGEFAPGDAAIIHNCCNARFNGERVVCESYNAALGEWVVKGNKFPLSVGMSLGTQFLEKVLDFEVEGNTVEDNAVEGNSKSEY